MSSLKQLKSAVRSGARQRQVITDLNTLVGDIERCDKTISELQRELAAINARYPTRRSTREDIAYLNELLKCAHKKLAWEKNIASLQKRTPAVLDEMSSLLNDSTNPPPDEIRAQMLKALREVQAAMERLQNVSVN